MATGRVYRSAALAQLTDKDVAAIERLGIALVVDFRTSRERGINPSRGDLPTWARDYDSSTADLHRAVADPALTTDSVAAAMRTTYAHLPEEQADAFAELFRRIAAGDVPLLFHCAVGKDRTGVAAALLLDLLGVDRADVVGDYLLTNRVADRVAAHAYVSLDRHNPGVDTALLAPVVRADEGYLAAMFAALGARYGSSERYLTDRLGIDAQSIAAIRDRLLVSG